MSSGHRLDERYELGGLIGRGGMAEVYAGVDRELGRQVAVKVPLPPLRGDDRFAARFEREARAAASLSHPNIVSVYDRGHDRGVPYLVVELVRGESLREILERGPVPEADALEYAEQVCAALTYAHRRGLVHRDLKPANVLIDPTGTVKLTDFGIVRAVGTQTITTTRPLGSIGYVAPEQATGGDVDARTDLYALGVVLYELLTGVRPFTADSPVALALAHVERPPRSPREHEPGISEAAEAITLRALAKDPDQRYPDADAMRDDLYRARHGVALRTQVADAVSLTATETLATDQLPRTEVLDLAAIGDAGTTAPTATDPARPRGDRRRPARAALLVALLLFGVAALLAVTRSPRASAVTAVPDVTGQPVERAAAELGSAGLEVRVADRPYHASVPAGRVISLEPLPGAELAPGSEVTLLVSAGPQPPPSAPADATVDAPTGGAEGPPDHRGRGRARGHDPDR